MCLSASTEKLSGVPCLSPVSLHLSAQLNSRLEGSEPLVLTPSVVMMIGGVLIKTSGSLTRLVPCGSLTKTFIHSVDSLRFPRSFLLTWTPPAWLTEHPLFFSVSLTILLTSSVGRMGRFLQGQFLQHTATWDSHQSDLRVYAFRDFSRAVFFKFYTCVWRLSIINMISGK